MKSMDDRNNKKIKFLNEINFIFHNQIIARFPTLHFMTPKEVNALHISFIVNIAAQTIISQSAKKTAGDKYIAEQGKIKMSLLDFTKLLSNRIKEIIKNNEVESIRDDIEL